MLLNNYNRNTDGETANGIMSLPYIVFDSLRLTGGFLKGAFTGQIDDRFRRSMIRLFCQTSGYALDFVSYFVSCLRSKAVFESKAAILPLVSESSQNTINSKLKADGYHVFDFRLSDQICDELMDFALKTKGLRRPTDEEVNRGIHDSVEEYYDRQNPKSIRFDYTSAELLKNPTVQRLISDPSILNIAQNYLGPSPILDIVAMWWSSASEKADEQAAQQYHYDMDNLKWLKFFFYITEVTEQNGPHMFIKGTHKSGGLPAKLRRRLYVRFTDQEVEAEFPADRRMLFTGPRGTVLAEDTRGLHKGLKVEKGDRLLFQLQFSNSKLLTVDQRMKLPAEREPVLVQAMSKNPQVFCKLK